MMRAISYRPGPWTGVLRSGMLVIVPPGQPQRTLEQLWEMLADGPDVQAVLHAVTAAFGGGIVGMPSFGIIHCSARVHAILRGPLRLDGHGQGGPSEVSGEHVTTWSERVLFGQDSLELSVSDDAPQESDRQNGPRSSDGPAALWLPLTEGVVRLSGMRIALGRAAPRAASQDAPPEHGQRTESLPGQTADHTAVPIATPQVPAQVTEPVPEQTPVPEQAPVPEPGSADAVASAAQQKPASGQPRAAEQEPADETASEVTGVYEPFVPDGPAPDVPPVPAGPTVPDGPAPDVPPVPETPPAPPAAVPGLIDSVPWLRANSVPARPPLPSQPPAVPPHPPTAAPATTPTPAAFATPDGDHGGNHDGDHDGNTVMRSSLTENLAVAGTPGQRGTPETVPAGTGPLVLGRACAQGHANPPVASACLACGAALTQEPRQLRRPALGQIRFSSGEVVTLDRPVVVGRQPSVSRVQGGVMPRMVQVASAAGDISRSHVEVRLDGWHVLLSDLKSTNGTVLIRPGQPARRLGHGETAMVLDGDIADLGDNISLRFEGIL